jgi:hypothetical protein
MKQQIQQVCKINPMKSQICHDIITRDIPWRPLAMHQSILHSQIEREGFLNPICLCDVACFVTILFEALLTFNLLTTGRIQILYWQLHMSKHRGGPIQFDIQLEDIRQVMMDMVIVVLVTKESP